MTKKEKATKLKAKKEEIQEELVEIDHEKIRKLCFKTWESDGYVENKKDAKLEINSIQFLIEHYAPTCLLKTIIDT